MSNWVGRTLGKVYIESLLARGGMAEVYLGTHTTLQREVVVKILRSYEEEHPILLERFQREARVVAKLRHPHIVQVFDFDTVDDQPYIVMEYIAGPSLSKYLSALHKKIGRLELPYASRLLTGVASALQYAHESGVIHRDVKPANILLASRLSQVLPGEPLPEDFEPVLTDFGLVRILSASHQTTVGRIAGTPAYMSPEQARGEQTDGRTDIYSLGIVLYEILAGYVPFDGESTLSVLLKHISEPPAPIPTLSVPLQNVLTRALAKNPADRFQTAKEFAAAFNAVIDETSRASTIEQPTPVSLSPVVAKSADRTPLLKRWMQAALTGAVLIAIGSFLLLGRPTPPETATPTVSTPMSTSTEILVMSISSPVPLGSTAVLRFSDGIALMDQVTITAFVMPAPPDGSQYEAWLINPVVEERLNLGILKLDEKGQGFLTYDDDQGRNLLALFEGGEITINSATESDGFEQLAYSYSLPTAGLQYIRPLLVSFQNAPKHVALLQGIFANTQFIDRTAKNMLNAYENNNKAGIQKNAEAIMSLLAGRQSQQYKDWDGDGQITDPGDGYGLLVNTDNLGYIQAVFSYADYAVNSPGASQNMIVNGEGVKTCAQNMADWAAQLQDNVSTILTSDTSELDEPIRDSVTFANQMLNGLDADNNGLIDPISGECGMQTAYEHAYHMVDMPLLPVNLIATSTPTPTFSTFAGPTQTSVRPPSGTSVNQPPQNTPVPPNQPNPHPQHTRRPPRPTKTPRR